MIDLYIQVENIGFGFSKFINFDYTEKTTGNGWDWK